MEQSSASWTVSAIPRVGEMLEVVVVVGQIAVVESIFSLWLIVMMMMVAGEDKLLSNKRGRLAFPRCCIASSHLEAQGSEKCSGKNSRGSDK